LMLVVDSSSSMVLETWDDDGDPQTPEVTRWSSARALIEVLVAEFETTTVLGLQRFPSADACPNATAESPNCTDADVCPIADAPEVALGLDQAAAILAALPDADADGVEIAGGSPASLAVLAAGDHLLAQLIASPSTIVLITDGGANCGDGLSLPESFETHDDSLVTHLGELFNGDGIPTFVVGVDVGMDVAMAGEDNPQFDAFTTLNALALAGGMPWNFGMDPQKFYDVRNSEDLLVDLPPEQGLTECSVELTMLPEGPPQPAQWPLMTIELDGMPVPKVADCQTENGWAWIIEGEIFRFCGSSCEQFIDGAAVEGDYGCPPET
jgi:hypothetical protein